MNTFFCLLLVQAQAAQQQPPPLPMVPYKPSADCTYSQLVNRIQGAQQQKQQQQVVVEDKVTEQQTSAQQQQQQQQYYQYYYATQQQYYEYYKQMMQYQGGGSEFSMENLQGNSNLIFNDLIIIIFFSIDSVHVEQFKRSKFRSKPTQSIYCILHAIYATNT